MKILIDMNLSPDWAEVFRRQGWEALHWSHVGDPRAKDQEIMAWAEARGWIVFTHDLDFGTLLAVTQASGPSVIQVRTQEVMPSKLGGLIVAAMKQFESELLSGALIVIDRDRLRARILPLLR